MRVVTWNVNRATERRACWEHLLNLAPDVVVLQEVCRIPISIASQFIVRCTRPITRAGKDQMFQNMLLVRGAIDSDISLPASHDWVAKELQRFSGNLFANRIRLHSGESLNVIAVYSPAWPVDPSRLVGKQTQGIQLEQNQNVWVTDLLWDALRNLLPTTSADWVIAGDFNLSETFDAWSSRPRGNREYLDRLARLELTECLRAHQGKLTPTFIHPRKSITDQIDHLFVTPGLRARLRCCHTSPAEKIFSGPTPRLSDHLPIIADFA